MFTRRSSIGSRAGSARRAGLVLPVAALMAVAAAAIGAAQQPAREKPYPIFSSDHFVAAMKTVGQAFSAVNAALTRNDIDDAKAYLVISRDRLATTITFWRDRKKDDAVRMLRNSVARLDDLDAALSVEPVDRTAVAAAAGQVGSSCENCHAAYRDQDPATKAYRFKTGLLQ